MRVLKKKKTLLVSRRIFQRARLTNVVITESAAGNKIFKKPLSRIIYFFLLDKLPLLLDILHKGVVSFAKYFFRLGVKGIIPFKIFRLHS